MRFQSALNPSDKPLISLKSFLPWPAFGHLFRISDAHNLSYDASMPWNKLLTSYFDEKVTEVNVLLNITYEQYQFTELSC